MTINIGYILGTHEDWGGASRSLLNFVRKIDREKFCPVVAVTQEGRLSRILRDHGMKCVINPKCGPKSNVFKYVLSIMASVRLFRRHRIDVIHLNYGSVGWKPSEILAARLRKIPIVYHYHIKVDRPSPYVRYAKSVIAVSKYVAQNSETYSVPLTVIHNIADIERFGSGKNIRSELGVSEDDIIVAFLGQLRKIKGIELFLDMAEKCNKDDVKFLIAGEVKETEPGYEQAFKAKVDAMPNVGYLGYREDPENLYASADIVVMPSQWQEPCAMVLFEAAAAGKPIVSSATGGTPEIIRHGENGFLFPAEDGEEMKTLVWRLIDDSELRKTVGASARRLVQNEFDSTQVTKLERLYLSLV